MFEFLLPALICGCSIAITSGPYGCFLVWQRKAFLGDTLAHSTLLGVALSLWLSINITITSMLSCAAVALALSALERNSKLPADTLLAVFAHTALATGVIAVQKLGRGTVNLESYLFGDLLAVSHNDLLVIVASVLALGLLLLWKWSDWLALTVNAELAEVAGISVRPAKFLFAVATAALIALAMRAVGVLLVSALLIIPAASARRLSHSPESMAILASSLGCGCVLAGLGLSFYFDVPAGPAIVVAAGCCYGIVQSPLTWRRQEIEHRVSEL